MLLNVFVPLTWTRMHLSQRAELIAHIAARKLFCAKNDKCISSLLPAGSCSRIRNKVYFTSRLDVLPAGRIGLGVNISSIIYFHLQSLKLFWSPPPAPASNGTERELTKRECKWINEWCGGTNESFMCCSSARLTLSNYLAFAFNGGVSKWDKSALTREILKNLGVRDMLTEWELMTLLRPPRSHTQLGTQAWCILSEDTNTGERFFFPPQTRNRCLRWTFRMEQFT